MTDARPMIDCDSHGLVEEIFWVTCSAKNVTPRAANGATSTCGSTRKCPIIHSPTPAVVMFAYAMKAGPASTNDHSENQKNQRARTNAMTAPIGSNTASRSVKEDASTRSLS